MTIKPKWRCDECWTVHNYEDDAHACCRPKVTEVYVCPICNEDHESSDQALNCCDAEVAAEIEPNGLSGFPCRGVQ